ncbi:MAG: phospholipid carrier-dependent glycosyltransferase, partial [Tangfeifania sp.]
MSRINHILSARNGFAIALVLAAILLVLLAPKAAVNVDEQLHYPHAEKVVNWYFTGGEDQSCLDTPKSNLKYYGQSVDNFTALINRVFNVEDEFLIRHFTGALFFWLLLFFTGLLARKLTGSYTVSVLTVLSLLLMPRLFGQAFGNLKDIPFATGYVAGLLMIVQFLKEIPRPRWRTAILLGLAIAFTVSVRAGGFILFAYLALGMFMFFILKPFYLKVVSTKPVLVRLTGQGIVIVLIGYFAGLLFWPYALQDVFSNPLESLQVMEHYKVSIRQIFEGELIWSTLLPWYYLPQWLFISTPEFVMLGFLLFLVFAFRFIVQKSKIGDNHLLIGFVTFAFLFPLVYVIIIDSN